MSAERRPHLKRFCPLREQEGCDWEQVTSWYIGSPLITQPVPKEQLEDEARLHLEAHYGLVRKYFT